ncbi:MAG: DUF3365 domain-containing protein [Desulfobacterales bacterium]|nr:DUF3365 domain-containing protein [Desulfobacterales bacterium]
MIGKKSGQAAAGLKQRFLYKAALILFSGTLVLSLAFYWNTRRLLVKEAMTRSEALLRETEAVRSYVKEELRPRMVQLHGRDAFIIEAMSTTYVSTAVMGRFAKTMPGPVYRRASLHPHNPGNLADEFEEKMFQWFEEDPDRSFWQGVVRKNGKPFFISMVPDYFAPSCIRCHGLPGDAPQSLLDRYGSSGGFRYRAGDLGGINSVAVPLSAKLRRAWQETLIFFFSALGGSLILLWMLHGVFHRLVTDRLDRMLSLLDKKKKAAGPGDEIERLHASVDTLSRYVGSARKSRFLEPGFIGGYVVTRPVLVGTLSWVYNGYCPASDNRPVSLKTGFEDVLQNPLARACFDRELQLFETHTHPNLPLVIERVDDVLVFEKIKGKNLADLIEKGPMDGQALWPVLSQLCDLAACLHASGIVHHDLRPQVFMLDDQRVCLTDMGLSASDGQPDPITAAGLGPQGDLLYMAPEQVRGERGDPRSDIYSLGVILYLAATGRQPFSVNRRSVKNRPGQKAGAESPVTHRPDMPPGLARVILKALACDPDERYQWVEDLWEDLDTHLKTWQDVSNRQ